MIDEATPLHSKPLPGILSEIEMLRHLACLSIYPGALLRSEFLQTLVNASKFLRYAGLLSNKTPIFIGNGAQFFHQI